MYRVTFTDSIYKTVGVFEFENLFDAIRVAKETNIGPDRLDIQAIPDNIFNVKLMDLLINGSITIGTLTVQLHIVGDSDREIPVYQRVPSTRKSTLVGMAPE